MQHSPVLVQRHSIVHMSGQTRTVISSALAITPLLQSSDTELSLCSNFEIYTFSFRSREEEILFSSNGFHWFFQTTLSVSQFTVVGEKKGYLYLLLFNEKGLHIS